MIRCRAEKAEPCKSTSCSAQSNNQKVSSVNACWSSAFVFHLRPALRVKHLTADMHHKLLAISNTDQQGPSTSWHAQRPERVQGRFGNHGGSRLEQATTVHSAFRSAVWRNELDPKRVAKALFIVQAYSVASVCDCIFGCRAVIPCIAPSKAAIPSSTRKFRRI